ncbi:hypothetical protein G5I_09408 [Acromyrmex echinatior]|uniref:Uncharacterized protein n=1 Tax=Acromyrmex echinatior TaxID=103372 RepID=F4WU53_ACREC|nr:hypothetical protein G5I_09408 [Acromyrmex echinatior]
MPPSFAEEESKDEAASQRRQGGYTCSNTETIGNNKCDRSIGEATIAATTWNDNGEGGSNGGSSSRLVAPSQQTLQPFCVLIQPPPVLARGPDRRDQRQAVPFPELDYSGVLEGGGKNRQHDDNHHDHDDEEEGASQRYPKRCGDVTLVGEPYTGIENEWKKKIDVGAALTARVGGETGSLKKLLLLL